MVSMTALCLHLTMGRVSAQIAQYAACLVRRALRRPNPPEPRDCRVHVWGNLANGAQATPKCRSLWPAANSSVNSGLTTRKLVVRSTGSTVQQQNPRALDVLQNWDVSTVSGAFSTPAGDEPPPKSSCPQRNSEHLDPLFRRHSWPTLAKPTLANLVF